ncbi:MAG TPA: hypothetical protein VL737_02875 [Candidatus Pristimantibacillus sp.]|nr:hypothetical protein [Candidatus Pristimantibacillus sp.]
MAEIFSEAELKALREAEEKDYPWDPKLARLAGHEFAKLVFGPEFRRGHPTPSVIVGVGAVGTQLALETWKDQQARPWPPDWRWAEVDALGVPRLESPISRGHAVIVGGSLLPDEQLTALVRQIRAEHATISDMAVVVGENWPLGQPSAARALGLVLHPLITG